MPEYSLQLKLSQKLALAPQLQQAIRLLQLTRLELREYIQETVEANPLLEQVEPGESGQSSESEPESQPLDEYQEEASFSDDYDWESVSDTWPGGSPTREESETDLGVNAAIARTVAGQELLAAAEAAGALTIERDVTVDDMSDYQVRKKHTAALRHEAMANAGRIRPQTARLRIDELAATVPVDIRTSQIEGTRTRIETGKASLPTPE